NQSPSLRSGPKTCAVKSGPLERFPQDSDLSFQHLDVAEQSASAPADRAINSRRFMELCPYDFVRRRISFAELSGKLWQCAKAMATCSVTRRAKLAWAPRARRARL